MLRALVTTGLCAGLLACGSIAPTSPPAVPPDLDRAHVGVALFGRSVTEGWFGHWGVGPGRGYQRGRFRLLHRPFSPYDPDVTLWPAQIDQTLQRYGRFVHGVQYKLCFVDFRPSTDLQPYRELADAVYRVVVQKHGRRLIIGNALPAVAGASSPSLVAVQRAYNAFLARFAAAHPKVVIFDQYAVLADKEGYLRAEYAASPADSHLNGQGYAALDAAYFALLERVFPVASR